MTTTTATGRATHVVARSAVVAPVVSGPPLVVLLLAGNPATAVALLQLLNTVDATALRRLHPAVGVAVEMLPWCDKTTQVTDVVRWRAAFPAATGARLVRVGPAVTAALLAGLSYLDVSAGANNVTNDFIRRLPPTLRMLDVHYCGLRLSDAVSFAHLPALETLDCSSTGIGNSAIATLPPSLQVLQADNCCMSSGADFRHLRALRTLKCCRLPSSTGRVNVCSGNLPSSLVELDLGRFCFTPHGAPFAHLAALRTLKLSNCQVPHEALASLPPSIKRLTLVTCTGLATSSFPHLPKLQSLDCTNSDIGDAAIASLPPSLSRVTITGGAACLTPAATFPPHMPALDWLSVKNTAIGDAAIASLPCSLRILTLLNCTSVTPAARLDHLVELKLLGSSGTNFAPSTLAACRARGCDAPADGTLREHGNTKVLSLAALPNGTLASGDAGGTVRLWAVGDSSDGAYHAVGDGLAGHGGEVRALVALRDAHCLAAGVYKNGKRGRIVLWNLLGAVPPARGATIAFGAGVTALAHLAGNRLAAGCDDGGIHVVDVPAGAATGAIMAGHTAGVTALAALRKGKRLASGGADGTVRVWDVGTRACVATLAGHTGADAVTALAVLAGGKLASGSCNSSVQLWDMASCTYVSAPEPGISTTSLAALPGGAFLSGTSYCFICGWKTADWSLSYFLCGHTRPTTALVGLPGNRLASASEDGTVRLWLLPNQATL